MSERPPVTQIEYAMMRAHLMAAAEALRKEPHPRLPALAGTLAIAAEQFERLRDELIASYQRNPVDTQSTSD